MLFNCFRSVVKLSSLLYGNYYYISNKFEQGNKTLTWQWLDWRLADATEMHCTLTANTCT